MLLIVVSSNIPAWPCLYTYIRSLTVKSIAALFAIDIDLSKLVEKNILFIFSVKNGYQLLNETQLLVCSLNVTANLFSVLNPILL